MTITDLTDELRRQADDAPDLSAIRNEATRRLAARSRARSRRALVAVAAIVVLIAGGATALVTLLPGGSDTAAGPAGSPAAHLVGRSFESTSVTGHELVDGTTVTIGFGLHDDPSAVSIQAGCNMLGGTGQWDGPMLTITRGMATEIGCPAPRMAQDEWVTGWLGAGVDAALDGDRLTLSSPAVTMELTDTAVLHPDLPLAGTQWQVDGIVSGTGDSASVSSVPDGIVATMQINDGILTYDDGVNHYGPAFEPGEENSNVVIDADSDSSGTVNVTGEFGGTLVGCASADGCSVDMSVLQHDFRYEIHASHLTVTGLGATADRGLMFVADH